MTRTIEVVARPLSGLRRIISIFALTIPWLNPFAFGPSPAVVPWLIAFAALVCLFALTAVPSFDGWTAGCETFSGRWASLAATAWLLAGVLSTGIALLQYFGLADVFGPWINHARVGEAFANLRQRNQFATLTLMALAALIWFAIHTEITHQGPLRARWVVIMLGCALAVGNAASQSRTGIAQLGLVCVLCGVWGRWSQPNIGNLLMAAVISYAVAALLLPILGGFELSTFGMVARLREGDMLCASRLTLWSNVFHLIAERPWLGWGWGELDYAHYMTLYPSTRFCDILDNAHNLPLHLAVELGVPVALFVCGGAAWVICRGRPWSEVDPTRQMAWSVLAVITLHSLLEYPLWYGPFQVAFGLCVCLLWSAPVERSVASRRFGRVTALRLAVIGVLLTSVAYAAWDYHRVSQIYLPPQARDAKYRDDTLEKIRDSRLFRNQVRFAELTTTPLTRSNAEWTFETASALLHFSPEPRVIEKVIESAVMLGRDDEAMFHLVRYRVAFPAEHAKWRSTNAQ